MDNTDSFDVKWDVAMPSLNSVRLRALAAGKNARERLRDALVELEFELARAPLHWGEPKFDLKKF